MHGLWCVTGVLPEFSGLASCARAMPTLVSGAPVWSVEDVIFWPSSRKPRPLEGFLGMRENLQRSLHRRLCVSEHAWARCRGANSKAGLVPSSSAGELWRSFLTGVLCEAEILKLCMNARHHEEGRML